MRVLITGGAGFIGSHLTDLLIEQNHEVFIYDNLDLQVHQKKEWPEYLNEKATKIFGDVLDFEHFKTVIQEEEIEAVFHFAAKVGVGQSMYQIKEYTDVNIGGTSNLLQILANEKHRVKRLIIAASMSSYGEGAYYDSSSDAVINLNMTRSIDQLKNKNWDFPENFKPVPTPEAKPFESQSIYALNKKQQEEMCMSIGKTYNIPTISLRFYNIYGQRQSLSNPYTGVAAVFCGCYLSGKSPMIFEDGNQIRDFIHVSDVVNACYLAMTTDKQEAFYEAFNVGCGRPLTVLDLANAIKNAMNSDLEPQIVNEFRVGDIRHSYPSIEKIKTILGFDPKIKFESGVEDLIEWVKLQRSDIDYEKMKKELEEKNLVLK